MTKAKQIILSALIVSLLTGCDFIKNSFTYKDKTKEFVEAVIDGDYEKTVEHFAMAHEMAEGTNADTLKKDFENFREVILNNWGKELKYSFMKAEKIFSTKEEDNTPPNTTMVFIQFSNNKEFGVFKVLFDDNSGKILNINTLDVKHPIPSMTIFWLFGLLALSIPAFNIYVIRKIKKSDLKKKWLKYIAVIFFNVPAFTYAVIKGLSISLGFEILLGVSFTYMGYLNSAWSFGLPFGGLYWFVKLRQRKIDNLEIQNMTGQRTGELVAKD